MNFACRTAVIVAALSAFTLILNSEHNSALGQKGSKEKDKDKGGKDKGSKDHDPVHQYHNALDTAMKKLKEAEKALLDADVKDLNLAATNPAVIQKLTNAVQMVNQAYAHAADCKQVTPMAPAKDVKKKSGKASK